MKTLVTGGAGFIGSHLAEALLAREYHVTVLDDLSTGTRANIMHLLPHPAFRFVFGSILDAHTVDGLMKQCDMVFHLAAAVGVRLIFQHPLRAVATNVNGTEVVLQAAQRYGLKVFLASTSEVYGKDANSSNGRFKETDDIVLGTSIRWCYACSKAMDEYLSRAYFRERSLPIVIGRFFNAVGPRQTGAYGMVVPRLVEQALTERPLTIYGDGEQVRTFTWVGDVVQAVIRLMDVPAAVGRVFNIGSDEAITINELAHRILHLTGSPAPIVHIPYEKAYGPDFEDTRSRVPDITRLRETIKFAPTLGLDEILGRVIAYVSELLGTPAPTTDVRRAAAGDLRAAAPATAARAEGVALPDE